MTQRFPKRTRLILAAAGISTLALGASAHGQLAVSSSVVAGGGGTSSGGPFTVSGTIGQPVVGLSSGGTLVVASGFWNSVTSACGLADVASLGGSIGPDGRLTADDIVVYLAQFFAGNAAVADIATLGGAPGADGQMTADDLVLFLARFFEGC